VFTPKAPIPADAVTASASGLDPHISPDSALAQVTRVAKARGASPDQMSQLVGQFTEGPDLGLLGEPRVNVLLLNLALDQRFALKHDVKPVVKQ
jgi:K+-transporting ATPase ATPase C chain